MAHKKAQWSTNNGRDSKAKSRWVKVFWWQLINAGGIVLRQCGSKFQLGTNVYCGRDFTIHAAIDGVVTFSRKKVLKFDGRKFLQTHVSVFAPAAA